MTPGSRASRVSLAHLTRWPRCCSISAAFAVALRQRPITAVPLHGSRRPYNNILAPLNRLASPRKPVAPKIPQRFNPRPPASVSKWGGTPSSSKMRRSTTSATSPSAPPRSSSSSPDYNRKSNLPRHPLYQGPQHHQSLSAYTQQFLGQIDSRVDWIKDYQQSRSSQKTTTRNPVHGWRRQSTTCVDLYTRRQAAAPAIFFFFFFAARAWFRFGLARKSSAVS